MAVEKLLPKTAMTDRFQVNEKVEIRTFEVGFEGSWHMATVVFSDERCFHVKYDDAVLQGDGAERIVEVVSPFPGSISTRLRPIPPAARCGVLGYTYGLCVDVWKDKAWWEAVVADRLDGSDQRIVFLIDSCTEIRVGIEKLRVTQDWDSATGVWRRRGNWHLIQWVGFGLNGPNLLPDQESELGIDNVVVTTESDSRPTECLVEESEKVDESEKAEEAVEENPTPSSKGKQGWLPVRSDMLSGPEFCPETVTSYASLGSKRPPESLVTGIRKHLLALGWRIEYQINGTSFRFRYISPDETLSYLSLRVLCQDLRQPVLETPTKKKKNETPKELEVVSKRKRNLRSRSRSPEVEVIGVSSSSDDEEEEEESCETRRWASSPDTVLKPIETSERSKRRKIVAGIPAPTKSKPKRKVVDEDDDYEAESPPRKKQRKKTPPRPAKKQRIRLEAAGCSKRKSHFVLSTMIDGNAVDLGAEVSCRSNKNEVKTGIIKREGICCRCCNKSFSLSGFESHAGSRRHRPAASIFLENGKSLSECCAEIMKNKRTRRRKAVEEEEKDVNDLICSACRDVGDLLCCDRCPSSFHYTCVGLEKLPDGNWFCPFCCCDICGRVEECVEEDGEKDGNAATLLSCDHCQLKFHGQCLQKKGSGKSRRRSIKGNWFCSAECGTMFSSIQQLVGQPVPLGKGNDLTWTLLRGTQDDSESSEKLSAAIDILHECFEPFKDDFSGTDIVEDLIYSKGSDLRRLNFKRFYTIVLQKGEEVACVANVRILGGKLAELPLVGTRFQYRGKGMCRLLMNELEKQLKRFGVEKLVLPAAHSVVNMWKDTFGFSELAAEERRNMVGGGGGGCRFLEFEGTVTCQKLLE